MAPVGLLEAKEHGTRNRVVTDIYQQPMHQVGDGDCLTPYHARANLHPLNALIHLDTREIGRKRQFQS